MSGAEGERASEGVAGAPGTARAHVERHHPGLMYFWREAGRCVFEVEDGHEHRGSCL